MPAKDKQKEQISARTASEGSELSLLLRVHGSLGTALGFCEEMCFGCVLLNKSSFNTMRAAGEKKLKKFY